MATYKSFAEQGDLLTEREAEVLINRCLSNYDKARKSVMDEINKYYGKYLTGAKPADYYNIMIQFDRLNKMLAEINKQYSYYSKLAGKDIEAASTLAMTNGYYRSMYSLSWIVPEISFAFINPTLVELSVVGTADLWKKIKMDAESKILYQPKYGTLTDLLLKHRTAELDRINQAITVSLTTGQGTREISKQITDIVGSAKYSADRIARTEVNRTLNLGSYTAGKEAISQGIELKKMWLATLDTRTRDRHAALDGTIKEYDQKFSIDGDKALIPMQFANASNNINCRCTTVDVIDDKTPSLRRGKNPTTGETEVFEWQTYNQWAKDNGLKPDSNNILTA